jgi:FKBP-type peptidyl-prolyl cis-trans isomerase FkpA
MRFWVHRDRSVAQVVYIDPVIPARLRRYNLPLLACIALAALAGCSKSPTTPSSSAPFTQVDLRLGSGTDAAAGKSLTVNYTGWLYDPSKPEQKGLQFDSSVGRDPFVFTLGSGQVIAGWEQGVPGMKIGGIRRLVIPPSLGYGDVRNNSIPPFATLVFEIELLDVQ